MTAQQNPAGVQNWRYGGPSEFTSEWWWNGYELISPDGESQQILKRASGNTLAPTNLGSTLPSTFPLVTKKHWMIGCLASTSNGQAGEGFLVVDPNGTKYWMDRLVFKGKPSIIYAKVKATPSYVGYSWILYQWEATMLPSRIEDRFGNYVTYTYAGSKLTDITSSDGRSIHIDWRSDAQLISKITAQPSSTAPRFWTYQYVNPLQDQTHAVRLSSVTQPDSRQWIFNLESAAAGVPEDRLDMPPVNCRDIGGTYVGTLASTITHPSGVIGTFSISSAVHGKSYVPWRCVSSLPAPTGTQWALSPSATRSPTLLARSLAGPALPAQTWTYQYSSPNASYAADCTTSCPTTIWTKVTEPDSSSTTYTFSNRWGITEGQLISSAVSAANATTVRSANQLYNSPSAGPYPAQIGTLFTTTLNTDLLTKLAPLNQRAVQQDGDTYTWQALAFDRYGNAVQTKRFNSIPGQTPIQEQVTLANDDAYNQAKWVLGQVKQKVNQTLGQTVYSTTYNANGLPQDRYAFGLKVMSYTWDAQGRLSTFKDGLNRTTTLSNYRFDIPRLVTFADNSTRIAVVSDFGEVTSLTNENGATTSYQYDSMGLLLRTDYPSGDTVAWAPTITTYTVLAASELGMPVGTWRARTTTGRSQTSTYYDARWRPVLVEEKDTTTGKVVYKRTAYDHESHHLFDSYPSDTYTATSGTNSIYDALGRLTLRQTTDGVTLSQTAYLTGAKVQTTDADGKITTVGHQVFDSPAYGRPIRIEAPENQLTVIERDLYGKIIGVTQSGIWSGGSVSATQTWTYDAYQRLCRKTEPETGSVILGYDAASQLKWQLKGQSGTGCLTTQPAGATLFGYDTRGRKTLDDEPGTADDVSYGYDAAGNPTSITNPTATWTYGYNKRGLIETEQAVIDGKTFVLNPTYDSLAHVQSLTTPARTIAYAPDAWGRPTQIGTWATGVQYYANGLPKNYTLGNGLTYLQTLNSRQWPQVQTTLDGGTVVQRYQYSYSDSGDLLSIDDDDEADNTTLAYDNLHRLKTATGLWGTYGYVYDPLNNIRSRTGPNALSYSYDAATNRLSSISGSQSRSYSYNAKGEVTGDGTKSFTLNARGQIQAITGIASYGYDGNGKRIKTSKSGAVEYVLYDLSGGLVYSEQDTTKTDYLRLGSSVIAELKLNGSTTTATYLHPDLLGSPRKATSANGDIAWEEHYDPYGQKLNGVGEKIGYTGHAFDAESGLTYMQARFYDPLVGRFLSEDPVHFEDSDMRTFNRYSYANNSPYTNTDPYGLEATPTPDPEKDKEPQKDEQEKKKPKREVDYRSMTAHPSLAVSLGPWAQITSTTKHFVKNRKNMVNANTIGADKYFHCKANCEGAKTGKTGKTLSKILGYGREASDLLRPDKWLNAYRATESIGSSAAYMFRDMGEDLEANEYGREFSIGGACEDVCSQFRPSGLDPQY